MNQTITFETEKIDGKAVVGNFYFADGRKGKGQIVVQVIKRQDGKSFFYDSILAKGKESIFATFEDLKAHYKTLRTSDIEESDVLGKLI